MTILCIWPCLRILQQRKTLPQQPAQKRNRLPESTLLALHNMATSTSSSDTDTTDNADFYSETKANILHRWDPLAEG
jgi:hypothetical protein